MKQKQSDKILYFAYGSNLSISQMKRRCSSSKIVRKGMLKNHDLAFTKYSSGWAGGVADVVKQKNKNVWGLLYSISYEDLKKLDMYEGYPNSYSRKLVSINCMNAITKNVWVYYVVKRSNHEAPSKKYLGIIKTAAHNYNFPKYYRDMLNNVDIAKKIDHKVNFRNLLIENKKTKPILTNKIVDIKSKHDRTYILDEDYLWDANNDDESIDLIEEYPYKLNLDDPDNLYYD